jgi:DNA polymerase-3 subunit epsilon
LIDGLDNAALAAAVEQIADLAQRQRYESAARLRDHTVAAVEVLWRGQRLAALAGLAELVAAAPDGDGGWQLAVIRYGQLAAAGSAPRGVPPMPVVDAIRAGAQVILPQSAPLGGALVEETALIARWLAAPGVRIVDVCGSDDAERSDEEERRHVSGSDDAERSDEEERRHVSGADAGWCSPLGSAGPWSEWAASARSARVAAEQAVTTRDSELLTEPHPSREQLFGGAAVDRVGGAAQPVFPGRQPLSTAG